MIHKRRDQVNNVGWIGGIMMSSVEDENRRRRGSLIARFLRRVQVPQSLNDGFTMPDPTARIFISYSRKDSAFVDRLADDLRERRIDTWVDRSSTHGGQDWTTAIQQVINESNAVVLALSPAVWQSQWIHREIHYAVSVDKPIIPVVWRPVNNDQVFLEIAELNRIAFTTSYAQGFADLVRAISNVTSIANSPNLHEDDYRRLPLDQHVAGVLNVVKVSCRSSNMSVYTPHILLALLEIRGGLAERSFERLRPGLADEVKRRLVAYLDAMNSTEGIQGYVDFEWEDRPEVQTAQLKAWQEGANSVTDRTLLLGILTGQSKTKQSLQEFLGTEAFHRLIAIIESAEHADSGTPGVESFFE